MNNTVKVCGICEEYTDDYIEVKGKYVTISCQGTFVRKENFVICGKCNLALKEIVRQKRKESEEE